MRATLGPMRHLSPHAAEAAAHVLLNARACVQAIDGLPEQLRPETTLDGYAIQAAFARVAGWQVAGWKIGCTAEDQRRYLKVDEPFFGRVYVPTLVDSPAELPAARLHWCKVEGEFAFRMARDLPIRAEPWTAADVADHIASLHGSIEIVSPRYADWLAVGAPSIIADNAANGALVLGAGRTDWQAVDLRQATVRMLVDGVEIGAGTAGMAYGSPLDALTWLVNRLCDQRYAGGDGGVALRAGQVVSTGTCTGIHALQAGQTARTEYGDLEPVEVRFTP